MPRFPGATYKPITAAKGRQPLTTWNRVDLHVAASEAASLHGYFNHTGIPDSHFYVRYDGSVEQYSDTAMQAFADLDGNDATISIETQGLGSGKWTPEQCETIAQIIAWAHRVHGIELRLATDAKVGASSHGVAWHRLGIDGNFPALPSPLAGRLQRGGGMHWSKSAGKECPGPDRIPQIPGILARAQQIVAGAQTVQEDDMALTADDKAWIRAQIADLKGDVTAALAADTDRDQWLHSALGGTTDTEPVRHTLRTILGLLRQILAAVQQKG